MPKLNLESLFKEVSDLELDMDDVILAINRMKEMNHIRDGSTLHIDATIHYLSRLEMALQLLLSRTSHSRINLILHKSSEDKLA